MAVTYNAPTRLDAISLLVSGTSDQTTPIPIRIYVDGVKVAEYSSATQDFSRIITVPAGESATVEVLDKENAVPSPAFSGRITLNWLAVSSAVRYRIEEYVSLSWIERATLTASGRTSFKWRTRLLDDGSTGQFRVTPFDAYGNEATPLTYSFLCVRTPDVPNAVMTYSNTTHKITITSV